MAGTSRELVPDAHQDSVARRDPPCLAPPDDLDRGAVRERYADMLI